MAGNGGTSGNGGAGGSGPAPCIRLERRLPELVVGGLESLSYSNPHLAHSDEARTRINLAFYANSATSPGSIRHVSLEPWSAWPPDVSSALETPLAGPVWTVFDIAQSFDGHMGLLAHAGSSFVFAPTVSTSSGEIGPNWSIDGSYFGFVERAQPGAHLVATLTTQSILLEVVNLATIGGIPSSVSVQIDCAPVVADAVPWNDGWLLAYSGPLDCASGTGEPDRIHVDYVAPDGAREPVALFGAVGSVNQIQAAPHPSGIQLAFRSLSSSTSPIEPLRVDVTTLYVKHSKPVAPLGVHVFDSFATAQLGPQLAVVWGKNPLTAPEVVVSLLDEQGEPLAESSFAVGSHGNLVALGSPDGQSLVVARDILEGSNTASIGLTRFDCVD